MSASKQSFVFTILVLEALVFASATLLLGWRVAVVAASIPLSIVVVGVRAWPLATKPIRHLIKKTNESSLSQLQGYIGLASFLGRDRPMPALTGWTLAADNAIEMIRIVVDYKPRTIVELGSGTSTLLLATLMMTDQTGNIFTLDHDEFFASLTRQRLSDANMDTLATVIYAPLEPYSANDGVVYRWYGESAIDKLPPKIDLLLVDGPPGREGYQSRYPAIERLKNRLSENAIVLLDDAKRPDENALFRRWKEENPDFTCTILQSSCGLGIMRRNA